jgi:hypothetical protein
LHTFATGIANSGEIVGEFETPTNSNQQGFVLTHNGNFHVVDVPGASATTAGGINASGQIVGTYLDNAGFHGFVDTRGKFVTVDVPGAVIGDITTTVLDGINDAGVIVGHIQDNNGTHGLIATPEPEMAQR